VKLTAQTISHVRYKSGMAPLPHTPSRREQEQPHLTRHLDPKHFVVKHTLKPHSSVKLANQFHTTSKQDKQIA
jgi:non-ribosomal peptide synthetase component E (peptide arylation enzyme)